MRTRACAGLLVLALIAVGCDWTQWGADSTRSGAMPEPSLTRDSLAALSKTTVAQLPASTQAVTAGGIVFIAEDGQINAFDAATHAVVWRAALPSGSTAGGALAVDVDSATVFVLVAGSGPILLGFDVYGIEHCDTQLNWCTPKFFAQVGTVPGFATPLLVAEGKVFAHGGNSVAAFDATGQFNCVPFLGTRACSPLWSAALGSSAPSIGPAFSGGRVFDAVDTASGPGVGAFDASSGALLWSAPLGGSITAPPSVGAGGLLFVPIEDRIQAMPSVGCGAPVCAPWFSLVPPATETGSFHSTPAVASPRVYSTNGNGSLYIWSEAGCGAETCEPSAAHLVNTPGGGSSGYEQTVAIANGVVFLLAQRAVSGSDHVFLLALDGTDGSELRAWDLQPGSFGAGRASASIANGAIYAPTDSALYAVQAPPVEPVASLTVSGLELRPAFSPAIHDYALRCGAGPNRITLSMGAVPGGAVRVVAPFTTQRTASRTLPLTLSANQAVVVEGSDAQGATAQYWIRCLPADFPTITATPHADVGQPTPGWYLAGNIANGQGVAAYAMILDRHGTPVWYRRTATNALDVASFARNTVSYMEQSGALGFITDPNASFDVHALGVGLVKRIRAVGMPTDLHELLELPNGNHLVLAYPLKRGVDLTGLAADPPPGPNSTIADCVVQEVTPQGELAWEWRASDHSDIPAENQNPGKLVLNGETIYDVFHCNSVDVTPAGDVLLSIRHYNAVILIRRSDGQILWKLGGSPVSESGATILEVTNDAQPIRLQHDARILPNGNISLFDNQAPTRAPARAVEYSLDLASGTAQRVFEYVNPTGRASLATGSFRRYSDGHSVICWGIDATFSGALLSELDTQGDNVLDISFGAPSGSYRALKVPPTRFDANVLRLTAGL
jgi:outer membrane protein assembly factor BamB